jgi:hypothetical protein
MRSRTLVAVAATVLLASFVLAGCGAMDPPGTKAAKTVTPGKPGQVTIETPGGTVDLGGEAGKVPAGLPKDLPLYTKGVKSGSVVSVPGGSGYTVQMVTSDSLDSTFKSYQTKLTDAGFKITSKGVVKLKKIDQAFITFSKGKSKGLVRITADSAPNSPMTKITVQITVPKS